jgi:hypothetical protein
MLNTDLLTAAQMKEAYGNFFEASAKILFLADHVPVNLRGLIAYAQFWGASDDSQRVNLVRQAPTLIRENLKTVVRMFDDELDEWLAGDEAMSENPSDAYIAFSSTRMAADMV